MNIIETSDKILFYINGYRVKEAKHLLKLKTYNKYSIEGIARNVGFNSKSSFNNAFKRFTGLTPSQYKKSFRKYG